MFAQIRYDNLSSAVKKVLKGRRRVETDRFVALRSHYLFESQFTTPGLEGAHEKGGVEGEVGRFRRNHLVPVPERARSRRAERVAARRAASATSARRIDGRPVTVGEAWARGAAAAARAAGEPFDACENAAPRVDAKSLVTVRQNRYSVPVRLAGLRVSGQDRRAGDHDQPRGREVARHERLHGKFGTSAQLDHYLELLAAQAGRRSSTRSRCARSAIAAPGRTASTSCGPG